MCPGQGSQHLGMGKELAQNFSVVRHTLEEASDILKWNMPQLFWEDSQNQLTQTEFTQPSLLTLSTACVRVLRQEGAPTPAFFLGHSLGEYSALVAAGVLDFGEALQAVHKRGQAMQEAVPQGGGMLAVIGLSHKEVKELCAAAQKHMEGAVVEVANFNAPKQVVLSGHKWALEKIAGHIKKKEVFFGELPLPRGARGILLKVSAPFHCSLMKDAQESLKDVLNTLSVSPPQAPVIANVDAQVYCDTLWPDRLLRQLVSPVFWVQSLETAHKMGGTHFVEVGPGTVLLGLLKKLPPFESHGFSTGTLDNIKAMLSLKS